MTDHDYQSIARSYAHHLGTRAYDSAYGMMSVAYRQHATLDDLRESFERIVPLDWGDVDPIDVVQTMDTWPQKQARDLLWVYLSLGGDVYSEGLAVVITSEDGEPRIRDVEFGRP